MSPTPNADRSESSELVKNSWHIVLPYLLLALFLGWVVWYASGHLEELSAIADVPLGSVLALLAVAIGTLVVNGLYTRAILRGFGITLSAREWLALSAATSALNFLLPLRGSAGLRAVYLKQRYRFAYSDFVSTLGVATLIQLFAHAALGLIAVVAISADGGRLDLPLMLFFGAICLASSAVILWTPRLPEPASGPLRMLARSVNGISGVRRNRALFGALLSISALFSALGLLNCKLAFAAYGMDLPWTGVLFYTAGRGVAMLASITPGALGIAELMSVYMGQTLGYGVSEALLVQGLTRGVTIALLLVAGPIAFRILGVKAAGGEAGSQSVNDDEVGQQ